MRNKLIHEYFGVDIDVVWQTCQKDLPVLKELINEYVITAREYLELAPG